MKPVRAKEMGAGRLPAAPPPAPAGHAAQSVAESKRIGPDAAIPMHCSGMSFVAAMREQMPGRPLISTTGNRFTFGV
ncbi:MAG TPA: hypothetical protein VI732_02545 [Alphaproteobacteria bacterium]|nr:hypothetical protein [Alphaproteobacteria bacterium]